MIDEHPNYLTPETVAEYFRSGTVTVQRVGVDAQYKLRIDPTAETLELFTPARGDQPDVTAMARLDVDTVDVDGVECFQLRIDAQDMHYEAYSVLASIVDDMNGGRSFFTATSNAFRSYRDLLNRRRGLTPERQQGLIGELLVLRAAREVAGPDTALESWLGAGGEEHDFVFATFDAEVKTTTSERRSHVIGSATQLQPSVGRPLWLVSIQLTDAGASRDGFSLSGLVGQLRTMFGAGNDRFLDYLGVLGWRDVDQDLYCTRYILRSTPATYLVDAGFPAITRPRLNSMIPKPELVGDVSYRVDVTTLEARTPPEPLTAFVQEETK
jgi:hypothetical protein